MNKLIGAALILFSCIMTASIPIYTMKQRLIFLSEFRSVLLRMSAELRMNLLSIPDLIEIVSSACGAAVHPILTAVEQDYNLNGPVCFRESWCYHVKEKGSLLTLEEQESLCNLGTVLGQFSLEDELAALEQAAACLQLGYTETREKYTALRRVAMNFGGVIGLIIVIALL